MIFVFHHIELEMKIRFSINSQWYKKQKIKKKKDIFFIHLLPVKTAFQITLFQKNHQCIAIQKLSLKLNQLWTF